MTTRPEPFSRVPRLRAAMVLVCSIAATACNVLDVDNPNNLVEDQLGSPASATSIANGAGGSVTRALGAMLPVYGAATDELRWIGSREGWNIADAGNIADQTNEFTDAAFFHVGEARWFSDDAIRRLAAFDQDGALRSRIDLANTYLYAAIIYTTIADMFDDFPLASDRRDAGDPVGETRMSVLYDSAVVYLDRALVIASALNDATARTRITAMRARAKYSKGLWGKVNPIGTRPAQPLVNEAGAVQDATAALALMAGADFVYRVKPRIETQGFPNMGFEINSRLELRAGDVFVNTNAAGTRVASIKLLDPVSNLPDPALAANVALCCIPGPLNDGSDNVPITIVSAREMLLILAEAALAAGNTAEFVRNINLIRAFNNLPAYNGTSPAPLAMLQHTRAVNLFMQGRRLADLYRFGLVSDRWTPTSDAIRKPGCFFPIPVTERIANPKVTSRPLCVQ